MADPLDLLTRANARLREHDRNLSDEVRVIAEGRAVGDAAGFVRESTAAGAPPAAPVQDRITRETIVRRVGRPVLAIRRDQAELVFQEPESTVWKQRLDAAKDHLVAAAKAVGRIDVKGHKLSWLATAWVVGDDILVTNRHVAEEFARSDGSGYVFRPAVAGGRISASIDFLQEVERPDRLEWDIASVLHIEDDDGPDVAYLRLRPRSDSMRPPAALSLEASNVAVDEFVGTIGYPARDGRLPEQDLMERIFGNVYDKKRVAPGQILTSRSSELTHDCSTLGGNSGSVIVSLSTGRAVGLHFAGSFLVENYAVPSHVVAERLDAVQRGVIRRQRSETPRGDGAARPASATLQIVSRHRSLDVTIPLRVRIDLGEPEADTNATASHRLEPEARPADYVGREGYQPDFLGNDPHRVALPDTRSLDDDVLRFEFEGRTQTELKYEHFSVIMARSRKMCLFSAANVDGKRAKKKKRGGWRTDPRAAPDQLPVDADVYGNEPRFARGHMTRREDPVWGTDDDAMRGNLDSMHMTNVVPQMQPFNAGIWLALEDYALDHAREDDMRISVFTGPILRPSDPERYGVKIPVEFWKVIAFIHDGTGNLCATGYKLSQKNFLRREEFVFGAHETTQVSIAWIEGQTKLKFGRLSDVDPLRRADEGREQPLTSLEQIRFTAGT